MTKKNIPLENYEIEEPYDYWDRGNRSDEYRLSRAVNPERKPEIDEGEDIPEYGVRY